MKSLCLLLLCLSCLGVQAAETPPSSLEFAQHVGAALPLDLKLRDEAGEEVRLSDYFGQTPVVLVMGYFHCPNLCSTLLDGVLESLARTELPDSRYRLLAVSIDPREGPAQARHKAAAYRALPAAGSAHFLTGEAGAIGRLAANAGFAYAWDEPHGQYMHPAGFLVVGPDGRIARYFLGVRFNPRDLGQALTEAAAGRTGPWSQRLLLLCGHYGPLGGRYSAWAMDFVRTGCLILAAALGVWLWRRRRAP